MSGSEHKEKKEQHWVEKGTPSPSETRKEQPSESSGPKDLKKSKEKRKSNTPTVKAHHPREEKRFPPRPEKEPDREYYDKIKQLTESNDLSISFNDLNGPDRFSIHQIAEGFNLNHTSTTVDGKRILTISKIDLKSISESAKPEEKTQTLIFNQDIHSGQIERLFWKLSDITKELELLKTKSTAKQAPTKPGSLQKNPQSVRSILSKREKENLLTSGTDSSEQPKTPKAKQDTFRFVNWNIEWMDHFFGGSDSKPEFLSQNMPQQISDVHALCSLIANLIKEIDADVISIEEGPSSLERMKLFVKTYLTDKYDCFGGFDGAQQRIYFLVKKNGKIENASIHQTSQDYLSKSWLFDVTGTFQLEDYKFARTPVALRGEMKGSKVPVYFVALHTKSKYIAGGEKEWTSSLPEMQLKFIKKSVANRRRIASECFRTRKCIDKNIFGTEEKPPCVLISGDLNDGPGMDFFEEYYVLFDSVELLLGSPFSMKRLLHPILLDLVSPDWLYSCVFDDYVDKIKDKKVLLDHIFTSVALTGRLVAGGVSHDLFEKFSTDKRSGRESRPSDHRPVWADFSIVDNEPVKVDGKEPEQKKPEEEKKEEKKEEPKQVEVKQTQEVTVVVTEEKDKK